MVENEEMSYNRHAKAINLWKRKMEACLTVTLCRAKTCYGMIGFHVILNQAAAL